MRTAEPTHGHRTQLGIPAYDAARWRIAPPPVRNVRRLANGVHCLVQVGSSAQGDAVQEAMVSNRRDESLLLFPDGSAGFDLYLGRARFQPEAGVAYATMGARTDARWIGHPTPHRMVQLHFPTGLRESLMNRPIAPAFEGQFQPAAGPLRLLIEAFCADLEDPGTPLPVLDAHVLLLAQKLAGPAPDFRGGLAGWQVRRVCEAMEACSADAFDLARFAGLIGLSASHFSRAFKQTLGCSPSRWHQRARIERAKQLLRAGRLPLAEVALLCGFATHSIFSSAFRRATGTTPGTWRRCRLDGSER